LQPSGKSVASFFLNLSSSKDTPASIFAYDKASAHCGVSETQVFNDFGFLCVMMTENNQMIRQLKHLAELMVLRPYKIRKLLA
jgi:hypothetical protein